MSVDSVLVGGMERGWAEKLILGLRAQGAAGAGHFSTDPHLGHFSEGRKPWEGRAWATGEHKGVCSYSGVEVSPRQC